jgi:hypothetical protein
MYKAKEYLKRSRLSITEDFDVLYTIDIEIFMKHE